MSNLAIIVDIETTGLEREFDSIIEIGAIKVDLSTGLVIDRFQTFSSIQESERGEFVLDQEKQRWIYQLESEYYGETTLDPFIVELTGITDEMLIGAPSNKEAVDAFVSFADDLPVWAYNARFDRAFINRFTDDFYPFSDVLTFSRKAIRGLENYKLKTVAQHLDLSYEGAHRGLVDCEITKDVLMHCLTVQAKNPELFVVRPPFNPVNFKPASDGPFFGKTVVFTGTLKTMVRAVAAECASKYGFTIKDGITKKTDYLVVGEEYEGAKNDKYKSSKQLKAEALIANGSTLVIITESEFLKLCP